jgi:hypothetical protein
MIFQKNGFSGAERKFKVSKPLLPARKRVFLQRNLPDNFSFIHK